MNRPACFPFRAAWAAVMLAGMLSEPSARAAPSPSAPDADLSVLLPMDREILDDTRFNWRQIQTEHFTIHCERKAFAAKVARLAEQFYSAISSDLPDLQDHIAPRRSHIFIFRHARDWQAVVAETPGLEPWTASLVRGQVMWLQELDGDSSEKMGILAHETTHLVFNRFLRVQLPLWLNEGLAEYYREFAYRAARGMGRSKRSAFPPLRTAMPLAELLAATTYPTDPAQVDVFYKTGKYIVGWLLWKLPREQWDAFFGRVLAGESATDALLDVYGWSDLDAMQDDFERFIR